MTRKQNPRKAFEVDGLKITDRDGIRYADAHSVKCGRIFKALRLKVSNNCRNSWIGGGTTAQRQSMLEKGSEAQVKRAREFAKKVEREIPVQTKASSMQSVVAGGAISVGRALSGNPICFTRPVINPSASNPVRVFIDIGCSAGVKQETVEKRGLAILAFALLLSKSRPVELIAFNYVRVDRQDVCLRIKFGMKPTNWGLAGAIIGHSAFLRDASFRMVNAAVGSDHVHHIGWGRQRHDGGYGLVKDEVLGITDKDVVFGNGFQSDRLLHRDPVEWVKKELERIEGVLA